MKCSWMQQEEEISGSSTVLFGQAGAGIDIMMTDTLAFVAEGMYSNSESDPQAYELDGWVFSVSMKYYFH